jgi:TolB protein
MIRFVKIRFLKVFLPLILLASGFAQDWIKTGTGLGVEKVRLAVPDFNAAGQDPKNAELLKTFNETLWNDLIVPGSLKWFQRLLSPR